MVNYDIVFTGEKEPTAFSEKMDFLKANLTGQTNPETGSPYTDEEIRQPTSFITF